jgi:putative endonuclease
MFYVYILQSLKDEKMYTGYTNNLKRRLFEHNEGLNSSTKYRRPLKLVYYEAYISQTDAMKREVNLKRSAGAQTALKLRIPDCLRSGRFV